MVTLAFRGVVIAVVSAVDAAHTACSSPTTRLTFS